MGEDKPIVDVIIPVYNYAKSIGRAIESVKSQTVTNFNCYIVNDGSTDNTEQAVREKIADDPRFHYFYQNNAGVAEARNNGVFIGNGKYVCCLDADDAIAPEFLETCIRYLEKDRSISIAYTGLYYIKPDGEEGLSKWPEDFDYDKQLQGLNQIPTCNVARREVWERLGGQRQRYAPDGAGEEDAEMWLRAGAYGFRAKKVTDAGFFIYSWMSGRVSGAKAHHPTKYSEWHPWVLDKQHPLASVASPLKHSHPVRQYDEPVVSVIIPVGNGHEKDVSEALDSLEAQDFRRWEAIVVWDSPNQEQFNKIKKVYPYAKIVFPEVFPAGAGAARNVGVEKARSPLLFFLDADDWIVPTALSKFVRAWSNGGGIIYSDYVGKSFIDEKSIKKYDNENRVLYYNPKTQMAVLKYKSSDFDCERAVAQPNKEMYIWSLVTALVPKVWHDEIGGFDPKMDSWEDWDYNIRMAKAGKCFYRIPEQLVVYRFYSGERRQIGIKSAENLIKYMTDKYREIEIMGCGCNKQGSTRNVSRPPESPSTIDSMRGVPHMIADKLNDNNYMLAKYDHPNRGQHRVIGAATGTDYGYRAGGDTFLVNRSDASVQPNIYKEIKPDISEEEIKEISQNIPETPPPHTIKSTPQSSKPEPEPDEIKVDFDLDLIAGITPTIKSQLLAMGINDPLKIVSAGEKRLKEEINGVGDVRASLIVQAAKELLGTT